MTNIDLKQAVILAGGRGERLKPLTDNIPKPMAPIGNIPFLDFLINSLLNQGIKNFLILTGYKSEVIEKRYSSIKEININFSYSPLLADTGKRVMDAFDKLDDYFLLLYGDNYWPLDLKDMLKNYSKLNKEISTTVFANINGTGEYGKKNNIYEKDNLIISYDKEFKDNYSNGVDIGYFIISKNSLNNFSNENISFEKDILKSKIKNNNLSAYVTYKQYYFITDLKSLKNFEKIVTSKNFLPLPNRFF